jgi:hypothetical protein
MGLFDFFKATPESAIAKHAPRVANKRGQASDRWESIQALGALKSADAVKALLPRFTFYADPSITDGEEKDEAFRLICELGDVAIPPVRAFAAKAESLSWALKILERLASEEEVVEVLVGLLSKMDVEYQRDPQRKLQVLTALRTRGSAPSRCASSRTCTRRRASTRSARCSTRTTPRTIARRSPRS